MWLAPHKRLKATLGVTSITNVWLHFCCWRERAPCETPHPPGGREHRAYEGIPPGPPPLTEMPTHSVSLLDVSHGDSEILSPLRASGESLEVRMVLRTPQNRTRPFKQGPQFT